MSAGDRTPAQTTLLSIPLSFPVCQSKTYSTFYEWRRKNSNGNPQQFLLNSKWFVPQSRLWFVRSHLHTQLFHPGSPFLYRWKGTLSCASVHQSLPKAHNYCLAQFPSWYHQPRLSLDERVMAVGMMLVHQAHCPCAPLTLCVQQRNIHHKIKGFRHDLVWFSLSL